MTYVQDEFAAMNAFIAEFPDAHIVRNALDGGEFAEAWLWIFDLAGKMKPAISEALRSLIVNHLSKYYDEGFVIAAREQLDRLPLRSSAA